MAIGPCGIPAFEVGTDGSVFCRYQHPTRFASPRRRGDDCFEIVGCVEHLRSRHESGLLSRQISCEVFMKLPGVEVSEAVSCFLYCIGFAEVTWKSFSVVRLIFSGIRHVGRDVDKTGNRWIRSGFGNYGSAIAVTDQNALTILLSEDALRRGYVFLKGSFRLLNNADVEAILDQNVVNTFPAGTICPGAED